MASSSCICSRLSSHSRCASVSDSELRTPLDIEGRESRSSSCSEEEGAMSDMMYESEADITWLGGGEMREELRARDSPTSEPCDVVTECCGSGVLRYDLTEHVADRLVPQVTEKGLMGGTIWVRFSSAVSCELQSHSFRIESQGRVRVGMDFHLLDVVDDCHNFGRTSSWRPSFPLLKSRA